MLGYIYGLVTWSTHIKTEGIYGRFDPVPTRFYIPIYIQNDTLFLIFTFVANYDDNIAPYFPFCDDLKAASINMKLQKISIWLTNKKNYDTTFEKLNRKKNSLVQLKKK